ncbi:hypothetical protein K0M31_005780 [Melipona bicolor]|uniref:Uncharacterized protein n=1 Tax=Melipona bicolor TaxID=60889 RepID=A0AA40KM18_9HYME|nr:hypothetical protein K0M31_005780 [Melipona bicolor]
MEEGWDAALYIKFSPRGGPHVSRSAYAKQQSGFALRARVGAACVTDEGYGLRFSVDEEQARNITGWGQNLNVNSFGWKNDGSSGFFFLLHFLCSLFAEEAWIS